MTREHSRLGRRGSGIEIIGAGWAGKAGCAVSVLIAGSLSCLVLDAAQLHRAQEEPATFEKVARRVFLEVRLAELEPVRGLAFEAAVKGSQKKVYLHYATLLANGDVQSARVVESGGRYDVAVTLTSDGAARMTAATARHVGRPIAIILDGEVVAVLTVRKPLNAEVVFSADFTQAEATRITSGLGRW